MEMVEEAETGRAPFKELMRLIEAVGYEVLSIGVESMGIRGLSAAINIKIAPPSLIEGDTPLHCFSPISKEVVSKICECAAQSKQQDQGKA